MNRRILERAWKSHLGEKNGICAIGVYRAKKEVKDLVLYCVDNPHRRLLHLDSFLLTLEFLAETRSPYEVFRCAIKEYRHKSATEIWYGRYTLTDTLLKVALKCPSRTASNFVMFCESVSQIHSAATENCAGLHPNGTGCSPGTIDVRNDVHCAKCGNYMGESVK